MTTEDLSMAKVHLDTAQAVGSPETYRPYKTAMAVRRLLEWAEGVEARLKMLEAQGSTQTTTPQSTTQECQHEPIALTISQPQGLPNWRWIGQCKKCHQAISTQWVTTRF